MDYIVELRKSVGNRPLINTGARIILENEAGQILLIKRKDNNFWGFPGGGLELGESILDSVIRETLEETGLQINHPRLIGVSSDPKVETVSYPNGDQVQNMALVFYSNNFKGVLLEDTNETLDARFFALTDLPTILPNEALSIEFFEHFKSTSSVLVK